MKPPGGAGFQLPAGVNCGWRGDKTQGRLWVVYAACLWSASMQGRVCPLCLLNVAGGCLKPPTQRRRRNDAACVYTQLKHLVECLRKRCFKLMEID